MLQSRNAIHYLRVANVFDGNRLDISEVTKLSFTATSLQDFALRAATCWSSKEMAVSRRSVGVPFGSARIKDLLHQNHIIRVQVFGWLPKIPEWVLELALRQQPCDAGSCFDEWALHAQRYQGVLTANSASTS